MAETTYPKELPDRPALELTIRVQRRGDTVTMEPAPVHGVIGFTVNLSRENAMALADALNSAAGDR
jgi:hypothetical protein